MKVLGAALGGEAHEVAASVALRVVRVNSACRVQWLMNITDVMNQETQKVRLSLLLGEAAELLHADIIDEALLVIACVSEPVDDVRDCLVDGVGIGLEVRVVVCIAALVEVGGVHEVPPGLPRAALSLDLVREGRTLDQGVVAL